jgi:AAA domain-containing protein/bifunctional DNA primase/polymerase-like protein
VIPIFAHDTFVALFGAVRPGDQEHLANLVRAALREGYAIVLNEPGTKKPLCTLSASARKLADNETYQDDMDAGVANPRTTHPCGISHALTADDATKVTGLITRVTKRYGAPPNIGIEPGASRLLVVDMDTAGQRDAFLAVWASEDPSDAPDADVLYTVRSPGKQDPDGTWAHKDGGHTWFRLPEGVTLPSAGRRVLTGEGDWSLIWGDLQVLVPPSVRAEGPYACVGMPQTAPRWMLDRIEAEVVLRTERARLRLERRSARDPGELDPVDVWSATTPWADLLEPRGWTATGRVDTCSCPTWTAPGPHGSPKSATAHDIGCAVFDADDGHAPMHVWTDNLPDYLHGAPRTITKLTHEAYADYEGSESAAVVGLGLAVNPNPDTGPVGQDHFEIQDQSTISPQDVDHVETPDDQGESDSGPGGPGGPSESTQDTEPPVLDLSPAAGAALVRLMEQHPADVRKELDRMHTRERAKDAYRAFQHAQGWTPPRDNGSLSSELEMPEVATRWRISQLLGAGHNAIIVAGRKSGKTVLSGNLVRSLVDNDPFLGRFDVTPVDGTVALFNYELADWQQREWLRDAHIRNTDQVFVQHLRGSQLPLAVPEVRDWVIAWLKAREVKVWIVDPYSRAYVGSVDNGNDEATVGAFLHNLDVIKMAAGVEELIMPVHTPKGVREEGEETAIGSQRLEAWPDALWYLTRDYASGTRFLRAEGRDIEFAEQELVFDERTRALSLGAGGGRAKAARSRDAQAVLEWLVEGNAGAGTNQLAHGLGWGKARVAKAVREAGGQIRVEPGPNNTQNHYVVSLEFD